MHKIIPFSMSFLILLLFAGVYFHPSREAVRPQVKELTEWTMETGASAADVTLPCTLRCSDMSSVTLTAQITPRPGDCLYIKSVYTPFEIYADETLLFAYGQPGTYPAFLLDPPTVVKLLPLPGTGEPVTLQLRYQAPTQRGRMTLHPVFLGEQNDLLTFLFTKMGFSLLFSIILIALGVLLLLIALILTRFDEIGRPVLWLGLFSFLVGVWILGECNLTSIFIHNPPLLYLMAFIGMFTLTIPLLRCGIIILNPRHPKVLSCTCTLMELAVIGAVILQLLGIAAFSRTMYLFHLLIPLAFILFAGCILLEIIYNRNQFAILFLIPALVLTIFTLLELMNYHLFHPPFQITFFFQLGILLFIGMMCILCSYFICCMLLNQAKNRQLSYELALMEKETEARKTQYAILSETAASIRAQRHDLRHHLTVIREYAAQRLEEKLLDYLNTLSANIPMEPADRLCENDAVNAVAGYYLSMAQKEGIHSVSLSLCIPSDTREVPETDLCVIVGNLLKNAIAACKEQTRSTPFIRMQSRIRFGIMTITMDNSCQTVRQTADGAFRSRKAGGGTGLISVRSVAERYGGSARFEVRDHVFSSSVYLYLEKP